MKLKYFLPILTLLIFSASGCSNDPAQSGDADSMAKFVNDKDFRDAHETPTALHYAAKGEMFHFNTPDGSNGMAYLVKGADGFSSHKFLFVVHEWWGLNDHIKQEADRLAASLPKVNVLALDLYDGKLATNPDDAGKFMKAVKPERCESIINGALAVAGKDGQVATIGWCFGGGWSLRSSILAADRGAGCVMYYGMPVEKADELAPLHADVLGIFAKKDGWIGEEVIGKFKDLAKATGKSLDVHWFDADHAFANPSSPKYNEAAAKEANQLALDFLKKKLD